jgi:hypothetical protein
MVVGPTRYRRWPATILDSQKRDARLDDGLSVLIDDRACDRAVFPRPQYDVAGPLAFGKFERLRRPAGTAHAIAAEQGAGRVAD